jgi:hypothetical protein
MRQLYLIATAAAVTFGLATGATAAPSSPASCHQAVNGLISMLDGKMDNTALYRDTFAVVVKTCGPAAPQAPQAAAPSDRSKCDDLAAAMTDLIDDDKMNSADFVKARAAFAQSCAPR